MADKKTSNVTFGRNGVASVATGDLMNSERVKKEFQAAQRIVQAHSKQQKSRPSVYVARSGAAASMRRSG